MLTSSRYVDECKPLLGPGRYIARHATGCRSTQKRSFNNQDAVDVVASNINICQAVFFGATSDTEALRAKVLELLPLEDECEVEASTRHSSTSQLNLSRFCYRNTPIYITYPRTLLR